MKKAVLVNSTGFGRLYTLQNASFVVLARLYWWVEIECSTGPAKTGQ